MRELRPKALARAGAWALAEGVFSGLGMARRLRSTRVRPPDLSRVRSILAIRLDLMGDVVFTLPAVYALRQAAPQARITMLVLPYTGEILDGAPYIDRVIRLDVNRWRRPSAWLRGPAVREFQDALRTLRGERFDLGVSFYGRVAAAAALLSGAEYLAGYGEEGYPFAFGLSLPGGRYRWPRHEKEYCMALARALGAPDVGDGAPLLAGPAATARVSEMLSAEGVGPGDRLVALHPGALNMAAKRWLPDRWARVADRVQSELGLRIVLVGASSELPLVKQVLSAMDSTPVVLAGRTSLTELVALLARCSLFMGGDSGPLHVAGAVGVPTVSIYGPTDPTHTGPLGPRARVLTTPEECRPCYDPRKPAECARWDPTCMARVSVDEVFEAVRGSLIDCGTMRDDPLQKEGRQ